MTDDADRGNAAVAAVEDAAFGGTDVDASIDRHVLHGRIAEVVDGPWWRTCGPAVTVSAPRRSARSSTARSRTTVDVEIRLADGQLTLATVAHELAHALAGIADGHAERFRAAHVDVVSLLCGASIGETLATTYRAFDLTVGQRRWPTPWRLDGESFRIIV